jgi:hypothetical protein
LYLKKLQLEDLAAEVKEEAISNSKNTDYDWYEQRNKILISMILDPKNIPLRMSGIVHNQSATKGIRNERI